jgi:peptidoglycan/xylan/chitin deacetylase (PgdA/CDA1 family)
VSALARLRVELGRAAGAVGALRLLAGGRGPARGALVLAYHDVDDAPDALDYSVTKEQLRSHVTWLREWGTDIIDLAELVTRVRRGDDVTGLASISFDDALFGVASDGAAVLGELGVSATVFTVAGSLGGEATWWPGASRVVSEAELRGLVAAGHRIGSHTSTHPSLPALDDERLRRELCESRSILGDIVGQDVDLLAYPSGHHDARVRNAARDAGYRAGFTFLNGRVQAGVDPFRIPRLTMTSAHRRARFARHVARPAWSWPDHQIDVLGTGHATPAP